MEDQLVTFETAKLAKKLGFNEVCLDTYDDKGILQNRYNIDTCDIADEDDLKDRFETVNSRLENYCTAPTQSLLQRWLRERYNIHIKIIWIDTLSDIYAYHISTTGNAIRPDSMFYHSYEESFENGLKAALEIVNETK